jgi:hypothetical protein
VSIVRRSFALLCVAGLAACSEDGPVADEPQHYIEGFVQLQSTRARKVDILLVLDNSSSMAEEQALLAHNLAALMEVLAAEDVEADYRFAITTTDAGHPSCPESTPERGAFLLTPCTSRQGEFMAKGEGGTSDVRALACTDSCQLDAAQLAILPTTTDEDPNPAPRPWLEYSNGHSNLPDGVDMGEALKCFGPQGVAGCDFEAPLESMYQALLRTQDVTDPAYGFLRKDAALLVVIFTDEDDCSLAPGGEEFFSADSTSAACWSAGVTCTGDPTHYDSCEAIDDDAVLRPPQRYADLLDGIMAEKRALGFETRPMISIVAGVSPNGNMWFADVGDSDPEFQQTFGIGPSCESPGSDPDRPIRATPPVRLAATQTAIGFEGALHSICEHDWSPVLGPIAPIWHSPLRPACFPHCALDTDTTTIPVEPDCIVEEELPDGDVRRIDECARGEDGYLIDLETNDYQLPPGIDVCHAKLTDSTQSTPSWYDDMSPECSDSGLNLEFKIARRPGHPAVPGSRVTATCLLSDSPSLTCPGLDD